MTHTSGRYRGEKIYPIVYHELIMAARYRGYVTYQEVAKLMGLPMTGNLMGNELGKILGEISEDEVRHGRPMLSALCVGVSGEPGYNFYKYAKDLGRLPADFDDSKKARRQFWEQEKRAVYEAWKVELSS